MQKITLYGRGAIMFHHGKDVYVAKNGVLVIPPILLGQAIAAGFSQTRNIPLDDEAEAAAAIAEKQSDAPAIKTHDAEGAVIGVSASAPDPRALPIIDPTRSDDDLLAQFETEAIERGYVAGAPAHIARERLAHLRAGGNGYGRIPVEPAVAPVEANVDGELKKKEEPTSEPASELAPEPEEKSELVELKGADTE